MGQPQKFSDEFINTLADDPLRPEEAARTRAEAAFDEAYNRRVCEQHRIRDLIRLAYRDLSMPGQRRAVPSVKAAGQRDSHK
jgi:hypothetical protein